MAPSASPPFPLPLELRLEIYKLTLLGETVLTLHYRDIQGFFSKTQDHFRHLTPFKLDPSILATCRAVNNEATQYLYASNAFQFHDPEVAARWLDVIGPSNSRMVSGLSITTPIDMSSIVAQWINVVGPLSPDMISDLTISIPKTISDFDMYALQRVFEGAPRLKRLHLRTNTLYVKATEDPVYFFRIIKPLLDVHETLSLATSPYKNGYQPVYNDLRVGNICITFVASIEQVKKEGDHCHVIDIHKSVKKNCYKEQNGDPIIPGWWRYYPVTCEHR
ncbi:MAG: hypothetical protein Q9209_001211 [Squamulea sp. 1 TL-2023]